MGMGRPKSSNSAMTPGNDFAARWKSYFHIARFGKSRMDVCRAALIFAMLTLGLPAFPSAPAAPPAIVFHLTVDPARPQTGLFQADTAAFNRLTLLPPRANPGAETANPANPAEIRCINGAAADTVIYGAPTRCARIEWRVRFKDADNLATHVAEQHNLYSATGWWALFEWDRIPRVQGVADITVCARRAAVQQIGAPLCRRLPPLNRPPLLLIFGAPALEYQALGRRFRIYTDRAGRALLDPETRRRLDRQYRYLSDLLPAPGGPAEAVHIAWVGIDKKRRAMGGAAGENAWIANYALSDNGLDRAGRERLFWISGHEAFHMLNGHSYPLWIEESLAHYYGYKSLTASGPTLQSPAREWRRQRLPGIDRETGLLAAHARVVNGDRRYYGLFYGKGAAFWQALDTRLAENGAALDRYLPLLADSSPQNGTLAPAFIAAITAIIGQRAFAELAAEYLE